MLRPSALAQVRLVSFGAAARLSSARAATLGSRVVAQRPSSQQQQQFAPLLLARSLHSSGALYNAGSALTSTSASNIDASEARRSRRAARLQKIGRLPPLQDGASGEAASTQTTEGTSEEASSSLHAAPTVRGFARQLPVKAQYTEPTRDAQGNLSHKPGEQEDYLLYWNWFKDRFFGRTDLAEIQLVDPSFTFEDFTRDLTHYVLPEIFDAYHGADRALLSKWCSSQPCERLLENMEYYLHKGYTPHGRLLELSKVRVSEVKTWVDMPPTINIHFDTTESMHYKDPTTGRIVAGSEEPYYCQYLIVFTQAKEEFGDEITGGWKASLVFRNVDSEPFPLPHETNAV